MADSKTSEEEAREYAESIINTVREPLIVLDHDLRVISASRSFYDVFKLKPEETEGQLIYNLGNKQWDIPELRQLLETLLPRKTTLDDYEVENEFANLGRRTMLLNARQVQRAPGKEPIILLAIEDITERKRTEQVLKESEQRYRLLVEESNDLVWTFDLSSMTFTYCSKSLETILGYSQEEVNGSKLDDIFPPETKKKVIAAFDQVFKGESNSDQILIEAEHRRKDGSLVWMEISAVLHRDNLGQPASFTGVSRDITQRKRAEDALQESEEKYRLLIDNLNEGIWQIDKDGYTVFVNDRMAEMLGYSIQEMQGKHLFDFMDAQEAQLTKNYMQRRQKGIKEQHEHILVCKDGSYIFTSLETSPVYDKDGKYIGALAGVQDVTARKRAEEALRRERNLKQRYLDTMQTVMVALDSEGRITMINRSGRELLGYTEDEILGCNWLETFLPQPEGMDNVYPAFRRIIDGDLSSAEYFENSVVCRDGTQRLIGWHNAFLEDDKGRVIGALSSGEDITERKQAEKALRESEERFKQWFESSPISLWEQDFSAIKKRIDEIKGRNVGDLDSYFRQQPELVWELAEMVKVLDVNQATLKLYRTKSKEEFFDGITKVFSRESLEEFLPVLKVIAAGEKTFVTEKEHVTLDGEPLKVQLYWRVAKGYEETYSRILVSIVDITERKLAERELRKSEEKYRFIAENVTDVIMEVTPDGTITYVSPSSYNVFGREEAPLSQNAFKYTHPEDLKRVQQTFEKGLKKDTSERVEYRYLHPEKGYIWFEAIGRRYFGRKGGIKALITIRDIDERKRAEDALRQSKNYYHAIFETSTTAMFILEEDTTISHVNSNFEDLLGYSKQEVEGKKSWTEFIHANDVGWMKEYHYLRRRDPRAAPLNYEFRFFVRNGELRHGYLTIDIIPDTTQSVVSLIDITERKQAEQQLRESEEKYRMLVENLNEVIYTLDEKGKMTYVSPSVEPVSGYAPSELLGKQFIDFVHPNDKEGTLELFHKRLSGINEPSEYRFLAKDNQILWMRTTARPLLKEGRVTGVQGVLLDITERKKAEQERDRMQSQLRQSQKMEAIGTLAGGIAHDFNNILSSVLGYTELSLDEVEKGSLVHQNLSQVLTAGNRAKGLVKQILAFGRKEGQEFMPTPIVPLVKEALKMLRSTFPSSITIRENISIDQAIVYAEPTQLHQVIVNLATNAKQAMSDEGGILEVTVETVSFDENIKKKYPDMALGNYVRITVNDTGNGISEQYLDKIFEPYFTTSETGTGTGLGLSVVHGIVKAHKGHITVSSEPGEGTTFYMYLPLAEQEQSRAASTVQEGEALPTGTESVLIVDDEKPIVEIQQQILEGLGYRVTPRISSVEALEAFRANPDKFDIVITDMTMPDMTGNRLALKIKEIRPDVPVILCTGFSEKIDDQKKGELGIEGLMLKPVARKELAETVRKILDKSGND